MYGLLSAAHEEKSLFAIESKHHNAILSLLENEALGTPRGECLAASEMHIAIAKEYSGANGWTFGKGSDSIHLKILKDEPDHNFH